MYLCQQHHLAYYRLSDLAGEDLEHVLDALSSSSDITFGDNDYSIVTLGRILSALEVEPDSKELHTYYKTLSHRIRHLSPSALVHIDEGEDEDEASGDNDPETVAGAAT